METLDRLIRLTDHFRASAADHVHPEWYKEWHHFCLVSQEVQVILNMSLCRHPRPLAGMDEQTARVILLVCENEQGWHGDIDTVPLRDVNTRRGRVDIQFGHNVMQFEDGAFSLSIALANRPITLICRLKPITYPMIRNKAALGEGKIDWAVIPRLLATGDITVGQKIYHLQDAPAYHDHNWGHWLWGQDFAWEWGFVLPYQADVPWSCVFNRVMNRARNDVQELKVSLWKGKELHRLFMHDEIQVEQNGYLSRDDVAKFPAVMALLAPERTTDIPRSFAVRARRGQDRLDFQFEAGSVAQIIIPNETNLDVTIINEVSGQINLTAETKGEHFTTQGRGFFEFLT